MSDEKFGTSQEVLDAFHYLAQDVINHPLVINPKPMTFNVTLLLGGEIHFGWDTPDSATWVELSTYVRKLAMLEKENTYISKVLNILARDYEGLRPEIQELHRAVKDWRGSKKVEYFAQAEGSDSLSVTSNAEAADIVINGYLFHADADLLRVWRKMDPFAQKFCLASAQDWVTSAAVLVRATSGLVEKAMPELVSTD